MLSPSRRVLLKRGQARLRPGEAGFSMPELMLVLAIIMLLVTLSIPNLLKARHRAEEAAAVQTLKNSHTAQEAYRVLHGNYAPDFQTLMRTGPDPLGVEDGGEASQDMMVYRGYIYSLNRAAADEYTIQARAVLDNADRPTYAIDQQGKLTATGSSGLTGGLSGPDGGGGEENVGGGTTPPPDEPPPDEPPPE